MRVHFPVVLTATLAQPAPAQSTFHGDIAHTGVFASVAPATVPHPVWKFKTGGAVISSPAVAGGLVYIGSTDGKFYAIDQATGTERWSVNVREPVVSSPAVADGLVYFLASDALYALSADSGRVRWHFATSGEHRFEAKGIHGLTPAAQTMPDPMDIFLSSPTVANHKVYVGSSDGHVYALDATTGVLQWSFLTGDVVHASPAVANNTVYFGSWDSYFYALDAESGAEKWRFKAGDDPAEHNQVGFQSSAAVVGNAVYVGCRDGHLYAMDATTGKRLWDYSTSQSWVNSTPAVANGSVYFGTSDTHRFHAVDARTGKLRFAVDLQALMFGSPAVSGNTAYIGAFNGKLFAVNLQTGTTAWEFRTDGSLADPMHILTIDGAMNPQATTPVFHNFMDMTVRLAQLMSAGAIASSPAIDSGVIYVGSGDGFVYALR